MKVYKEDQEHNLNSTDVKYNYFNFEVSNKHNEFSMHDFFVTNRNKILGQYVYLIHEVSLSAESYIDFIGFTEEGAILFIELKRGADSRNRQEVISQIGKYAFDSHSIRNLVQNETQLRAELNKEYLHNNDFPSGLLNKIANNIQQGIFNMYLVTEDASDEVLASAFYMSFGPKYQKINIIEINRLSINQKSLCFIRYYNKQPIQSSARKNKMDLSTKIDSIEHIELREHIRTLTDSWDNSGYKIDPLTESNPEYFTFQWAEAQSIWAYFYCKDKKLKVYDRKINNNSIAVQVSETDDKQIENLADWFGHQRGAYSVKGNNRGKTGSYIIHCIDVSDYSSNEFDAIFGKFCEMAELRRKIYEKKYNLQ
ncbi:MAG: hypothetical protein JEZ04_19325 [Spirochaetales bacterium]|nr:hypothetical protein [Spirochaetales bacterium]